MNRPPLVDHPLLQPLWRLLERLRPLLMQAARLALLLAVGAFLAINLMRSEQQAGRPATQGTFSATVRNMFVTETDDMGRLSLEMWAEAGWQHPDRSILLRTVHIRYHDPRQPKPWLLRANEALISADHSRVDLHGAVEAEILPRGRTVPMLMDTEALTAWPDEKRLVSEVGVMLHDKTGTWLHSQNLYYESNGLLRLSGHVRGHLVAIQHR